MGSVAGVMSTQQHVVLNTKHLLDFASASPASLRLWHVFPAQKMMNIFG
jgi:hypothetical protein